MRLYAHRGAVRGGDVDVDAPTARMGYVRGRYKLFGDTPVHFGAPYLLLDWRSHVGRWIKPKKLANLLIISVYSHILLCQCYRPHS